MDPYAILELSPPVTRDEAKAAYHRLARRHHPDFYWADGSREHQHRAEEAMKALNAAYRQVVQDLDRAAREPPPHDSPPAEQPSAAPPRQVPVCPLHAADEVYRCPSCGAPACGVCASRRRCPACPAPAQPTRRVGPGWPWLVVWMLGWLTAHQFDLSLPLTLAATAFYLAILGAGVLRRLGRWGILLWLIFPYSLVAAGLWRVGGQFRGARRRA